MTFVALPCCFGRDGCGTATNQGCARLNRSLFLRARGRHVLLLLSFLAEASEGNECILPTVCVGCMDCHGRGRVTRTLLPCHAMTNPPSGQTAVSHLVGTQKRAPSRALHGDHRSVCDRSAAALLLASSSFNGQSRPRPAAIDAPGQKVCRPGRGADGRAGGSFMAASSNHSAARLGLRTARRRRRAYPAIRGRRLSLS